MSAIQPVWINRLATLGATLLYYDFFAGHRAKLGSVGVFLVTVGA